MKIELTLKHFNMFIHTQCSTDGMEMPHNDRFFWEEGNKVNEFDLLNSHLHWVSDGPLQAITALQILQSEGYKAGLFWDDSPLSEPSPYLAFQSNEVWGYVIFTDMTLKFDSND